MNRRTDHWPLNVSLLGNGQLMAISLIIITSLISGCATTIKQDLFTKFSESAETLRDGTDKAMGVLIPQTVTRYKQDLLEELKTEGSGELYISSRLELNGNDPFQFESGPRYMVFDQFKVGLRSMTDAMHKYTVLLRDFANEEIQSDEEFKKLAKDLNANAFEAVRTVDKLVGENTAKNIGIISTAAAAAFNNYLKNQQKEVLLEAIEKNQPTIEQYAEEVKEAIAIIAKASNKEYLDRSHDYTVQMKTPSKSSAAIDALIKLNRGALCTNTNSEAIKRFSWQVPFSP